MVKNLSFIAPVNPNKIELYVIKEIDRAFYWLFLINYLRSQFGEDSKSQTSHVGYDAGKPLEGAVYYLNKLVFGRPVNRNHGKDSVSCINKHVDNLSGSHHRGKELVNLALKLLAVRLKKCELV